MYLEVCRRCGKEFESEDEQFVCDACQWADWHEEENQ
jgi:DNA-directed RNA polymerase subunit RPC12/RpoP